MSLKISTAEGTQPPRPYSGSGVLIIRPFGPDRPIDSETLTFYRNPGVERIVERPARDIPSLSSILKMPADEYPFAVMGKKGNWMRIAYDDAGREGWVEMSRWWEYITWEVFLMGRAARLIPGLKKENCALRAGPATTEPPTGVLSGKEELQLIEIRGDWIKVVINSGLNGWLTWRDGDGRFLIFIGGKINPQKR